MSEQKTEVRNAPPMKMPKGPMRGRGMPVPKGSIKKGTLGRLLKFVFKHYKWRMLFIFLCIIVNAMGSLVSSIFVQSLVDDVIIPGVAQGFDEVKAKLIGVVVAMSCIYGTVILAGFFWHRIMATVTQGVLYHLRKEMFAKMQTLPIKYFDTHAHGEIMSSYTNDTDATRQLIGQSLPTLFSSSITLIVSVGYMLWHSLWLFAIVLVCTFAMMIVVKKIGGNSAKYMVGQQTSLAREEGFVEE
ncbi:MAG: ABC transporter ATP-binding protein, partial [Clostridia bacterium]|nr:ABC transporter ATP-binding protein [Clostridia bacterium]